MMKSLFEGMTRNPLWTGGGIGAFSGFVNPGEKSRMGGAFSGGMRGLGGAAAFKYGGKSMIRNAPGLSKKGPLSGTSWQDVDKLGRGVMKGSGMVAGGATALFGFGRRKSGSKKHAQIQSNNWNRGTHPSYF